MSDGGRGRSEIPNDASNAPPKNTSRRPRYSALREVILARAGIVCSVAEALKVAPRTVRRWRDGDPRVLAMFHEAKEAVLDLAEAEVVKGIRRGVPSDRYFFLKCHGRSRGWIERGDPAVVHMPQPNPDLDRERRDEIIRHLMADPEARKLVNKIIGRIGAIRREVEVDAGEAEETST